VRELLVTHQRLGPRAEPGQKLISRWAGHNERMTLVLIIIILILLFGGGGGYYYRGRGRR
jgi:hypothetical protein